MRFLRNPEVLWVFLPDLLIAALSGFLLYRFAQSGAPAWKIALLAMVSSAAMGIVFLVVSGVHSAKVQRFMYRIETNLHDHQDMQFEDFREGDFSNLQSLVFNMVYAHFQQESLLLAEKQRLKETLENISHQLKTPLAAISLNAELLASPDMDPSKRRMAAHRVSGLVERTRLLIRTLLNQSRIDAGVAEFKKETFSADHLIDKAIEHLELTMDLHNQTLVRDIPPDLMIEADLFWLTEALMNVIKNCTEATPDGGTITIRASADALSTYITVRDTGPGIAPEVRRHIFERFAVSGNPDKKTDSVGLGMPYAKQLLYEMNGRIEADNHPDGGALFTITLDKGIV